jgi:hypothetical protein
VILYALNLDIARYRIICVISLCIGNSSTVHRWACKCHSNIQWNESSALHLDSHGHNGHCGSRALLNGTMIVGEETLIRLQPLRNSVSFLAPLSFLELTVSGSGAVEPSPNSYTFLLQTVPHQRLRIFCLLIFSYTAYANNEFPVLYVFTPKIISVLKSMGTASLTLEYVIRSVSTRSLSQTRMFV